MRKLSFRCPDGVVKLIINASEELEERVIVICYNVFRRAIVGKDKSRTAARFKRAINADALCRAAESNGALHVRITVE